MKLKWIASAALALGISAASPLVSKAHDVCDDRDFRRDDRREVRVVERHDYHSDYARDYGRDYSRDYGREYARERVIVPEVVVSEVNFCDVPRCVQDRVNEYRHGRGIESTQRVEDCGHVFYQFRICDRAHGDFTLQIEPSGHLFARL